MPDSSYFLAAKNYKFILFHSLFFLLCTSFPAVIARRLSVVVAIYLLLAPYSFATLFRLSALLRQTFVCLDFELLFFNRHTVVERYPVFFQTWVKSRLDPFALHCFFARPAPLIKCCVPGTQLSLSRKANGRGRGVALLGCLVLLLACIKASSFLEATLSCC